MCIVFVVVMCIVTGRFSWLSKKLFALKEPPDSPLPPSDLIDYTAHLSEVLTFIVKFLVITN